ncbi:MAG TPA: helix-turn-helix transcriptional regulator [Candidatus Baltobacteraceae bacterium]|jgi:transcriptional regulator with XRE-family HTH domain|nr:helix-turn-helix transcriptional regulator [Candidatus Baltobacteraceae bacterium]
MNGATGTDCLQDFRLKRGITQEEVAEELIRLAEAAGLEVRVDASMISKWERGQKRPRRHYRRLLCRLYEATEEDLGLTVPKVENVHVNLRQSISEEVAGRIQCLNVGDISQLSISEAIVMLQDLTGRDITSRKDALIAMTAATGALLLDPIRQWVRTIPSMSEDFQPSRIGLAEVESLEEMVARSAKWSGQTGSYMRKAAIGQLRAVGEILEEAPSGPVKIRLFEVAAQMAIQAGWMSYEALMYGIAQRYYLTALHFCREAGNRQIAARAIGDLSRLATDMGNHQEALELRKFALYCLPTRRQGLLRAELLGYQASTQARLGETSDARRSIEASVDANLNVPDKQLPPIFGYLDSTMIHYVATTAYLNLVRHGGPHDSMSDFLTRAEQHAIASIRERNDNLPVYRAMDTIQLMNIRLLQGEPTEAIKLGNSAIDLTSGVRSSRVADRLVKFDREVQDRYPTLPEIAEFHDRLRFHLIRSGEKGVSFVA